MMIKGQARWVLTVIGSVTLLLLSALYLYSFTDFTVSKGGAAPEPAAIPFVGQSASGGGTYTLSGVLTLLPLSPGSYNIVADDRLLELHVNGQSVNLDGVAQEDLSNWERGFHIDLGQHLHQGANSIKFVIKDGGGLYGVRVLSDLREPRLIIYRCLWAACLGWLVWNALRSLQIGNDFAAVILVGVGVRILYTWVTDFNVRGHDTDEHLAYVLHFVDSWSLPELTAAAGGAFFHPPLYYFVASIAYRLADLIQPGQSKLAYAFLQYLSLVFSTGLMVYAALLIRKVFDQTLRKNYKPLAARSLAPRFTAVLTLALIVFWPSLILHSPRIGNDSLLYFMFVAGLYHIYSFFIAPSSKDFLLGSIFAALAVAAKANGAILLALGGITLLTMWWCRRSALSVTLMARGAGPVALMLGALCLTFYPGVALKLKGERTHVYVDNIDNVSSALRTENEVGNYLWFDLKTFLTEPYTSPYDDAYGRQYFANYLSKTGLVGEWWYEGKLASIAAGLLSATYLLLITLFIVGFFHYFRGDYLATSPLLSAGMLLLASVYYMKITFPVNIDFRYILPVVVPFSLLYNLGLVRLSQVGKTRLALTGYMVEVAFIGCSLAFLLHFLLIR